MKQIKAGIVGGAGYTGGELLRLLVHHPHVKVSFIHSRSNAGKPVASVHHDLLGETKLHFTDKIDSHVDVMFLCMGHGESKKFLEENTIDDSVRIIDLSQDFRLEKGSKFH
ncbi:MAG TPA: N-acetyl-gamma-glutamyl-phosphate reductase, partial [Chitinophagaceae bacterium]